MAFYNSPCYFLLFYHTKCNFSININPVQFRTGSHIKYYQPVYLYTYNKTPLDFIADREDGLPNDELFILLLSI